MSKLHIHSYICIYNYAGIFIGVHVLYVHYPKCSLQTVCLAGSSGVGGTATLHGNKRIGKTYCNIIN